MENKKPGKTFNFTSPTFLREIFTGEIAQKINRIL